MTGKKFASLAGAINRFSRSDERKQRDLDEAELLAENGLDDDVDNFYTQKKRIKRLLKDIDQANSITNDSGISDDLRSALQKLTAYHLNETDMISREYGPNIVWAHQAPARFINKEESIQVLTDRMIDLKVKIGKLRRNAMSAP